MPATLDTLIGRDRELRAITGMLADSRVHLVTLTGPGGTGKSRLAIDSARQSIPEFRDGVYFVGLAAVQNPDDVTATIARTIGVRDSGDALIADKLALALRHRHILLVLDNFEQVLSAAAGITALLAAAPDVTALVTSRSPLRVRGEHVFNVDPLGLPEENESTLEFAGNFSAIELFVERARAAKPDFELTETNVADVARICRALDGLPLALELVAARIRLLPPAAMIERLDRQLGSLVGRGIRDLPTRQQTLLSTVTWSTDLLAPDEVHLLKRLGVFSGGFSLEAAESIATESERDVLTVLESLVDSSLVRQQDSDSEPHFTMLATVREWARDRLRDEDALDETCDRQASYYLALSKRLGPLLIGPEQLRVSRALAGEHENVVRSVARLIETGKTDDAAQLAWNLYTYWWVAGHLGEVSRQMTTMLSTGLPLGDHARAVALYFTRAINFWRDPDLLVVPGLAESSQLFERSHDPSGEALARISLALGLLACETPDPDRAAAELSTALERFRSIDDQWGEALTLVTIGRISILSGDTVGALTQFEASLQLARSQKDDLGEGIALNHIGWAHFLLGNTTAGAEAFAQSLDLSILLGHTEGIAYGLEGFVAIAAALGQVTNAGTLMGAAQSLRRTTGLYNSPTFSFHEQAVVRILASEAADEFQQARRDGQRMRLPEAIELAQRIEAE
jgi:predicted ATPase